MQNYLCQRWGLFARRKIVAILETLGINCQEQGINAPFAILANDKIRIEVKASRWVSAYGRPGRYQFNIRPSADWYILCCHNGVTYHFIMPAYMIGDRHNIAIWTKNATRYRGVWSPYLENWMPLLKELTE